MAEAGDYQKSKTINGKKYEFDENGAMTAEWSLDVESASKSGSRGSYSNVTTNSVPAKYAQEWRYFQDVENGARISKGWFKVVAAEYLNYEKNNDGEDAWYYADGSGKLYAGEFKTIKGKKYAFRTDGRMIDGLKFIKVVKGEIGESGVKADDDADYPFDTEDDFINSANWYEKNGYSCYYFGGGDDGAMRTNKNTIEIDGEKFNFFFEKSGAKKGAGKTGEDDDKIYQSGMLLKAGRDEKYQVVKKLDPTVDKNDNGAFIDGYKKLDDVQAFIDELGMSKTTPTDSQLKGLGISRKADDIDEFYLVPSQAGGASTGAGDTRTVAGNYFLINTSGKIINSNSKNKDGSDYYYVVQKSGKLGKIVAIYTEK